MQIPTRLTHAERYLKRLCDRSFLSLWSYVGIHNDKGTGQELCDLLVVFDNHVIIFSDKDCEFPNTGDVNTDWKRWYRKAIKKSADQVFGAERWIFSHPNRIFLDQAGTSPFPLEIPRADRIKIHRIVVAHSVSERCKEFFGGGSGSLLINSEYVSDESPFMVGKIDASKGFVHVLDDTSLDIVLNSLDTAADFVSYLSKKERFFSQGVKILSAGEEELLALYLKNLNEDGEHDFIIDGDISSFNTITLDEGFWREFSEHPQRHAQLQANQVSYFWDDLIEKFTRHFREGTLYDSNTEGIQDQERLLRLLARESRVRRRFLSDALAEFVDKTPATLKASRVISPFDEDSPYYLFLLLPQSGEMPYSKYRKIRQEMLEQHCRILKLDFPDARDVIGLATESGRIREGSEDLCYLDTRDWTTKDIIAAEQIKRAMIKVKLLNPRQRFEMTAYEYPRLQATPEIIHSVDKKGKYRNVLCGCGSGRKIKKCCGATGN